MARIILAVLMLFSSLAFAQDAPIPPAHRVVDTTNTLAPNEVNLLATKLKQLEESDNITIGVLMVPTTNDEDIFSYSQRVFDTWKLGNAKDSNGLLIVVAKNDRKMRIHTGAGVENTITDRFARQTISNVLAPNFKQGKFYIGIDSAINEITDQVKAEPVYAAPSGKSEGPTTLWLWVLTIFITIVVIGITVMWFVAEIRRAAEAEKIRRQQRQKEAEQRIYAPIRPATKPSKPKPPAGRTIKEGSAKSSAAAATPYVSSYDEPSRRSYSSKSSYSSNNDFGLSGGSSSGGGASGDW